MIPFQSMLAAQHLDDLRREAANSRRARDVAFANGDPGRPDGSDTRRALARVAITLSRAASATARRLDPGLGDSFRAADPLGASDALRPRPILGHHEAFSGHHASGTAGQ